MTLDLIIYGMASLLLVFALFRRAALLSVLVVCASLFIDRLVFESTMTISEIRSWALTLAVKDLALISVICYRGGKFEIPILLGLVVSGFVNYWVKIEAQNQNLTLFYHRPDIMSYIVAGWLASVAIMLIYGGEDGGKRARHKLFSDSRSFRNILHYQAYKVRQR